MASKLHSRVWVLVERLYLTVHCKTGNEPYKFIEFLKRFGVEYHGLPYSKLSTVKGLYTFMSQEDYTFATFMGTIPASTCLTILEEIIFDSDIRKTRDDNWNYYGESINNWYPEVIRLLEEAGIEPRFGKDNLYLKMVKDIPVVEGYEFDVALSFAGEDREYIEQVAEILQRLGAKIFYDKYEEVTLWGKDLYSHLDDVYQRQSRYVVMFISKHYRDKVWTNHERESAQARAYKEKGEYILPARFDQTEVPGVKSTIGYIDLSAKSPTDFANLIARKIGLKMKRS